MAEQWRVGERRFLGLDRRHARIAAVGIALLAIAAGVLCVLFVTAILMVIAAVAVAIIVGVLSTWWYAPIAVNLGILAESRERDREASRRR